MRYFVVMFFRMLLEPRTPALLEESTRSSADATTERKRGSKRSKLTNSKHFKGMFSPSMMMMMMLCLRRHCCSRCCSRCRCRCRAQRRMRD